MGASKGLPTFLFYHIQRGVHNVMKFELLLCRLFNYGAVWVEGLNEERVILSLFSSIFKIIYSVC